MTQVADINVTVQLRILSQVKKKKSKSKGETKRLLTLSMPQELKSASQPERSCFSSMELPYSYRAVQMAEILDSNKRNLRNVYKNVFKF